MVEMKKTLAALFLIGSLTVSGAATSSATSVSKDPVVVSGGLSVQNPLQEAVARTQATHVKNGVTNKYLGSNTASNKSDQVIGQFTPNNAIKLTIKGWQNSTTQVEAEVWYTLRRGASEVETIKVKGNIKPTDTSRLFYKEFTKFFPGVTYTVWAENRTSVGVNVGLDAYWDTKN
ncbi:hypothetical protein [Bacillus pumilus]|uniref:hypothetical protein n=1 Tax=Bacillus pumilus TaxID=1408 RepID=UPI00349EA25D